MTAVRFPWFIPAGCCCQPVTWRSGVPAALWPRSRWWRSYDPRVTPPPIMRSWMLSALLIYSSYCQFIGNNRLCVRPAAHEHDPFYNMWNIEFTLGKSQTCGIIQPRTTHDYGIEMWNYEIKVIIIRLKVKLIKEKSHTDGRDSLKHEINVIIIRLKVKIGKEKVIIIVKKVEMMR